MIFLWHCRDCDEKGEVTVSLSKLAEESKPPYSFFDLLISFVRRTKHAKEGCTNIGIRAKQDTDA